MLTDLPAITSGETEQLHELWRIAADTKLTDTRSSLGAFTKAMAALLDAKNVVWLAAIHGKAPGDVFSSRIFEGWWCLDIIDFDTSVDPALVHSTYFELAKKHGPGEDTIAVVKAAGHSRVQLRQDIFSDEEHEDFWKTKHYNIPVLGIKERMHTVYAVTPVAESYFLVDRAPGQGAFSERERTLARLAISGSANLHRRLMLERGLIPPAAAPLSPREKETLPLLCSELTQKEIASTLEVSPSTASQYINSIYRKFNVRGRNGLISCCM